MSYPENPKTIIIKNSFYQGNSALTELDIYNHYIYFKNSILEQVRNRDVMIFLKIDNSIIVKRKGQETNFIRLTNKNYDYIISGRTLSIHTTMKKTEDIGIVDIDTDNFNKAKEATKDCYEVLRRFPIFTDLQIRFTGKSSFHIFCTLSKKLNIDSIRLLLLKIFKNSSVAEKYTISKARTGNIPNIDLFRNSYRSGFIVLNSLSVFGLKCMEVKYNELNNFVKERSVIK